MTGALALRIILSLMLLGSLALSFTRIAYAIRNGEVRIWGADDPVRRAASPTNFSFRLLLEFLCVAPFVAIGLVYIWQIEPLIQFGVVSGLLMLAGVVAIATAMMLALLHGLARGRFSSPYRTYTRQENPFSYWTLVAIIVLAVLTAIATTMAVTLKNLGAT